VLGAIAFSIAIIQLRRIKRAAVAAQEAIEIAASKIGAFSVIEEATRAEHVLNKLHTHLREKNWSRVIDDYQDLIALFLKLSEASASLAAGIRQETRQATVDMARICEGIDRAVESSEKPTLARQLQAARNFREIMTRISFAMKREI
jgi:hypothetical protein